MSAKTEDFMVTPGYLPYLPAPKKPDLALPEGACDAHCHVFGPSDVFPYSPGSAYVPVDAPKEVLFARHRHLGISRGVVVQASCHGTDNSAMIDALRAGRGRYRGVAIVDETVGETALQTMHEAGVRGVRFNFVPRLRAAQTPGAMQEIIARIAPLGWHVVLYFEPRQLDAVLPFIYLCPLPVVIDHLGRTPVDEGLQGQTFMRIRRLLEEHDHVWIKLSCPERLSVEGPPYRDVDPFARVLLETAPERTLWGTDWPHPNMKSHMPDDGMLVDRLKGLTDDAALRRLLVANPARLYWDGDAP